jgi:hypothetical protein
VCYQANRYPLGTISKIGPGFLPFYMGILLAALSVIILLRVLLGPIEKDVPPWKNITKKKALRVIGVLICMVAYAFLLKKFGFPVTTFLFTLTLLKLAESYSWIASTLIAMAASLGNYLIFSLWLQGQFPKGWLGI